MKEEGQKLYFNWSIQLTSSPEKLWPFLSDSNMILKRLRFPSVQKTPLSRSAPKGFLGMTNARINSYLVWEQEPYIWEQPFRFGTTRNFETGLFKNFKYLVDFIPNAEGTVVRTRLWFSPNGKWTLSLLRFWIDKLIKRRYLAILKDLDKSAFKDQLTYEQNAPKALVRGAESKSEQLLLN